MSPCVRKFPVNFGIIYEDNVLYSSDMEIASLLDLAKFSISFASNLVKDSELLRFTHEPSLAGHDATEVEKIDSDLLLIRREHVIFKFLKNKRGETVTVCMTYASADDLKDLGFTSVTPQQLASQANSFIDAYAQAFKEAVHFDYISFSELSQEEFLQFHQTTIALFEEVKRITDIILLDTFPYHGNLSVDSEKGDCQFLFASLMNGSVPVASKFFEKMEGFFKIRVDTEVGSLNMIIENLISAQLSTIMSTARSISHTMIRQVEIRVRNPHIDDKIYIGFYPVKNDFSIVFISRGSPTTLQFFTQATAAVMMEMEVLDEKFTGDLSQFEPLRAFINDIPSSISHPDGGNLDDLMEDISFDIIVKDKGDGRKIINFKRKKNTGIDDPKEAQFFKTRDQFLTKQEELNNILGERKFKAALKKIKSLLDLSHKIDHVILSRYYGKKLAVLLEIS
ncbi:MAG: hypothetical protein ACTSUE_10190 [Promethearchaeota archaeon]